MKQKGKHSLLEFLDISILKLNMNIKKSIDESDLLQQ